jgi:chromosome partitioning protein
MIYTVGGYKGGSSKTTIAMNLVVYLQQQGRRVLVCDADDQESAKIFNEVRSSYSDKPAFDLITLTGNRLHQQLLDKSAKYDDVVVDTGGRDTVSQRSALSVTNAYLVPFPPRATDLWTCGKVDELVGKAFDVNPKLRAFSFVARADTHGLLGSAGQMAVQYLGGLDQVTFVPLTIGNRVAFDKAMLVGLSVFELTPADPKAIAEANALFDHIQRAIADEKA